MPTEHGECPVGIPLLLYEEAEKNPTIGISTNRAG